MSGIEFRRGKRFLNDKISRKEMLQIVLTRVRFFIDKIQHFSNIQR